MSIHFVLYLNHGYHTVIDCIDADLAVYKWRAELGDCVYAIRNRRINESENPSARVRLHREILSRVLGRPLSVEEIADHVNGDSLDNRRSNLRLATTSQNVFNRRSFSKTGFKGVTLHKCGKWQAQISANGRHAYLGLFDTAEAAHEAYKVAAQELHGEFANFKSPGARQ